MMYYVVFLLLAFDLYFYNVCSYVTLRLDICRYLSNQIGTDAHANKQTELLLNVITIHRESYM